MQELESKGQIDTADRTTILKLRVTLIKNSREYCKTFPRFNQASKQGKAWCPAICYHVLDYIGETVSAEDVKFAIYGATEIGLRTRVLHMEPGTIRFNSFSRAEYQEEMLGRFMNTRTKGGAKQEF